MAWRSGSARDTQRARVLSAAPDLPLVGRDELLGELRRELESGARLITLVGPAGVGKSALARALVATHEGAILVSLTGASDDAAVVSSVAEALRVGRRGAATRGSVGLSLAAREAPLLVLDELAIAGADVCASIEHWQRSAPGARLLITSRVRLSAAGEHPFEVPPLEVPRDAAEIARSPAAVLWERAVRRIDVRYRASSEAAADLRALLAELDGLPAAIELAASTMGVLTVSSLLARLGDGGTLRERVLAPLLVAAEEAWASSTDEERAALSRLSAFRGGFTVAQAEAVLPPELDALAVLGTLRARSFVRQLPSEARGEVRLDLYDVVARVARSRTDGDTLRAASVRHAEVVVARASEVALAAESDRAPTSAWSLADDRQNLVAAAQWAAHEGPAALAVSAIDLLDETTWLRATEPAVATCTARALERPDLKLRHRALLLEIRGRLRTRERADARAEADLDAALQLAREAEHPAVEARALRSLALALSQRGEVVLALPRAREALAAAERASSSSSILRALRTLATLERRAGRLDDSHATYERCLALSTPGTAHRGAVLAELSMLELEADRVEEALDHAARAEPILRSHDLEIVEAYLRASIAACQLARGEVAAGRASFRRAAALSRGAGDATLAAVSETYERIAAIEEGDVSARPAALESVDVLVAMGARSSAAVVLCLIALHEAAFGRHALSASLVRRAESLEALPSGSTFALAAEVAARTAAWLTGAGTRRDMDDALARGHAGDSDRGRDGPDDVASDLRLALRLAESARAEAELPVLELHPDDSVRVGRDAVVSLAKRPVLSRLLRALAAAHRDEPGATAPVDALLEAGWPGERMVGSSGPRRLQVAIGRLRDLGLRDLLQTSEGGYRLDPRTKLGLGSA